MFKGDCLRGPIEEGRGKERVKGKVNMIKVHYICV
jgi:hypothetical protein